MKMSDKISGENTRGQGFASPKPSAKQPKPASSAISPVQPMANALGDSYKAHGSAFVGLITEFQGSTQELNGKLADVYVSMADGSWAAQDLMQQIAAKMEAHKPAKFNADLGFEPPSITDGIDAVEQFYTKTSFLRGTPQAKQITGK